MDNHYHLLVLTREPTLGAGMQRLNGIYVQRFNLRHRRDGRPWGDRFFSLPLRRDSHLLEAVRYIAWNPVRAGLCARPEDWRWSAHRALLGLEPPAFVNVTDTLAYFAAGGGNGRTRYRDFVAANKMGSTCPSLERPRAGHAAAEEVLHVARLARLELSEDEQQRMTEELTKVLDHIERIGELGDLADVVGQRADLGALVLGVREVVVIERVLGAEVAPDVAFAGHLARGAGPAVQVRDVLDDRLARHRRAALVGERDRELGMEMAQAERVRRFLERDRLRRGRVRLVVDRELLQLPIICSTRS